jgi:hypothetical protein
MTNDRERTGDWNRTDWVGEGQGDRDDERTARGEAVADEATPAGDRWNKSEWVGDQGQGTPAPVDPDRMPEGEPGLSGDRHSPGEQHWADGQERDQPRAADGRPLDPR